MAVQESLRPKIYEIGEVMAKKATAKNAFTGSWRIVSMSAWEDEYLDEDVQAYIEFDGKGLGYFQFGYVQGQIDYQTSTRDGKPSVEFSWEGGDGADGSELAGRGWAVLEDGQLDGMFFVHMGDASEFIAKPAAAKKRPKTKRTK